MENREDRERKRLEALKLYEILDTLPEEEYDDIATLAAEICHTPIAVISIIDGDRHWFKSKVGLDISETDRNFSFCAYAQGQKDVFEVKDLIDNPTFSNHPLVTGYPYMRYYAGTPLITSDGHVLGTLCVIHTQAHELSASQKRSLTVLAKSAITLLELKYKEKQAIFFKNALNEIAAVAVFDRQGNYEYANNKYCDLADVLENDIIGKNHTTVALADTSESVNRRISEITNRGEIYRDTIKNINKKGDVSWSNLTVIPYQNDKGELVKLFTIRIDATTLIQLIDRFHKAELLSGLGSWEINMLNGKRFWSEGMYSLVGIDAGGVQDEVPTLLDYIVPEQRALLEVPLKELLMVGIDQDIEEVDIITVDGIRKTLSFIKDITFDRNGKPVVISGTVQDITAGKETEKILNASFEEIKKLSDSREVLSLTADNLSAMLAYWDKDLICRFANGAYLHWFGRTKDEMINKMTIVELLGPLYEKNKQYIDNVLKGQTQTFEREIPLPEGDGSRFSLANYIPHFVDGVVTGFFVHVADITPQKLLELEIRQTNERINEKNKMLVNFANIVTHNLKSYSNNLGVILDMFIAADNEAEKVQMLGFLKDIASGFSNTIVHLTEIVDTQNKQDIKREPLLLQEYIQRAVDTLRIDIENTNASVKNNVGSHLIFNGNRAYIDSMFLNFLTNAIKYKHPDRDPIIKISADETAVELVITIEDNGCGIDLEKYGEKLFGMYQTFHGNSDAKGVGLYLVKSQVEAMNGVIEVASKENIGTTFTIRFKK